MPEPRDPAAAGVASLLKSLRTRAGLTEERLASTELALDALTGLDPVREIVAAGEPVERAIVQAVSEAASSLGPMLSIVADVSLRLKLSEGAIPDPRLYDRDLGQRRDALLANWNRLHELRSAPLAGKVPTLRTLRLELEVEALSALARALTNGTSHAVLMETDTARTKPGLPQALTAERLSPLRAAEIRPFGIQLSKSLRSRALTASEAAEAMEVTPAEVAQWEAGRDIPSEPNAKKLDKLLQAEGAIYRLAEELRAKLTQSKPRSSMRLVSVPVPTMLQEFQAISFALRSCLVRDDEGRPMGWPLDLRQPSQVPTAVATAYGLKTMLLLDGYPASDLKSVAERLKSKAFPSGGFASRGQKAARPEGTAAVLDALYRINVTETFDDHIATIEKNMGDFEKSRPFILATVLESSVRLRPDSNLTSLLVNDLLAARRPYGEHLLWPEKAEPLLVGPAASAAHTARAVRALAQVQAVRPSPEVRDALEQAAAWLTEQRDLRSVSELIERPLAGDVERHYVLHFTAAWVVKALTSVGLPASHPAVGGAVNHVWRHYNQTAALWAWDNGDLPVWMTFDAVDALRMASSAIPTGTAV